MTLHTIYLVTNRVNGKQYVGQTKFSATCRWGQHRYLAKRRGGCVLLNRAINKYGSGAFDVQTLLKCEKELVDDYETMFIDMYDTVGERGYNIMRGGRHSVHGASTKLKMSRWRKENGMALAVSQWTLDGKHVRDYESLTDAARETGALGGNISAVIKGFIKSAAGYAWTRLGAPAPKAYTRIYTRKPKRVAQLDADGNVLSTFPSIKKAAEAVGRTPVAISKCASGVTSQSGGFCWKYV